MLRFVGFLVLLTLAASAPASAAQPLSSADAQTYRSAFDLARKGKWTEARKMAGQAKDPLLEEVIVWLDFQEPGRGGTWPCWLTIPQVGLWANTPQNDAGTRSEPPMSEPSDSAP